MVDSIVFISPKLRDHVHTHAVIYVNGFKRYPTLPPCILSLGHPGGHNRNYR